MLAEVTAAARRRAKEEALARIDAMWAAGDSPGTAIESILDAIDERRR